MPRIDWLQFTVKEYYDETERIQCKDSAFSYLPKFLQDDILSYVDDCCKFIDVDDCVGINFYQRSFKFKNGIRVCFAPIKVDMGFNVIISGDVLSSLEWTDSDISEWFAENSDSIIISRLDVAWDTDIDFSVFYEKYQKFEYITRLRDIRQCVNEKNRGTLYFGKRSGRLMIRVYDKRQEQLDFARGSLKRKLEKTLPKSWTRFEMQFRHDMAQSVLVCYLNKTIGNVALGHFRFIEPLKENSTNKSRDSKVWKVYKDLVEGDFRMVISKKKKDYVNIEYLCSNVMPQIKALIDYSPELYRFVFDNSVASKTTLKKLKNDEIANARERRIIAEKQLRLVEYLY